MPGTKPTVRPRSTQASTVSFLRTIGYLEPAGADFEIDTEGVDVEIAEVPGPQLVVPVVQRALRAERGERPLGLALRRALRHGRARRCAPLPVRTTRLGGAG